MGDMLECHISQHLCCNRRFSAEISWSYVTR